MKMKGEEIERHRGGGGWKAINQWLSKQATKKTSVTSVRHKTGIYEGRGKKTSSITYVGGQGRRLHRTVSSAGRGRSRQKLVGTSFPLFLLTHTTRVVWEPGENGSDGMEERRRSGGS